MAGMVQKFDFPSAQITQWKKRFLANACGIILHAVDVCDAAVATELARNPGTIMLVDISVVFRQISGFAFGLRVGITEFSSDRTKPELYAYIGRIDSVEAMPR